MVVLMVAVVKAYLMVDVMAALTAEEMAQYFAGKWVSLKTGPTGMYLVDV